MANPTAVNDQITDAIAQSNVQVVSESPAVAMGNLYQTTASAISISMQNAVANQQQNNTVATTATAVSIEKILSKK